MHFVYVLVCFAGWHLKTSDLNCVYLNHMWQSHVEVKVIQSHVLIASPHSKHSIAELPLRAGLIRASWIFTHLRIMYEPCPEVQ